MRRKWHERASLLHQSLAGCVLILFKITIFRARLRNKPAIVVGNFTVAQWSPLSCSLWDSQTTALTEVVCSLYLVLMWVYFSS